MATASRVRTKPVVVVAVALSLVITACSSSSDRAGIDETRTTTSIEDYPDAQTRRLRRLAAAPRPVPHSALPPRHLDAEQFPLSLVDRYLIVSGGPPPDAIASIDEPRFEQVADVDWLADTEPVLVVTVGSTTRAYPIQIMIWHEIVNDEIEGQPVVITYCPLCNSGVAFERVVEGELLDFGTSGSLYQSALVMYDRQTESLWTHFDGLAVIGDYLGTKLSFVPTATISWTDYRRSHPDGEVLSPADPTRPYGRNPYGPYDQRQEPSSGFFSGEVDARAGAMDRVVGLQIAGAPTAISRDRLQRERVIYLQVNGRSVVVWHRPGTASALNASIVADGTDIGATGSFYTDRRFSENVDGFVDDATSSTWDVLGTALSGPEADERLEPIAHVDTFWFAWSTYHPETELID